MTKSRSKQRATPKLGNLGGVREVSKKLKGSDVIFENRENLAEALIKLGSAKITDIMTWNEEGDIFIKKPEDISETALQSIKKIKAIPRGDKVEFEIEMIDKVRILQLLAKSSGLLDRQAESEKPSVIEIQMVGPDGKSK
tara:strand:- start:1667 stop:2086 length:420 start_codon:yes stop_codon:yes gene_type:complete